MDTEDNIGRYKKIISDHRQELEDRYHVSSLGLFGSRLRGDYREDSDLMCWSPFRALRDFCSFSACNAIFRTCWESRSIWLCVMP